MNMGPIGDATPIQTQDFLVTAKGAGEFGLAKVPTGKPIDRLFNFIKALVEPAAEQHKQDNCDETGALKPDRKDHITRVITSEFLFYTESPLSLKEFQDLQQRIVDFAKTQPENLQFILSSFAVLTPENKVVNVLAHIQCGPNPKIDFFAKNNPSSIDPNYRGPTRRLIENLKIEDEKTPLPSIEIDGKQKSFTKDCIVECVTAGGQHYLSCVEICLDHHLEVGRNSLNAFLQQAIKQGRQDIPTLCSHVISAGSCDVDPDHAIATLLHVDSRRKPEPLKEVSVEKTSSEFGKNFNYIKRQRVSIDPLLNPELKMVVECNRGDLSLATAVNLNQVDDCERILAKGGTDINHRYENHETILFRAIKLNHSEIVAMVFEQEAAS